MAAVTAVGGELFSVVTVGAGPSHSLRALLGLPRHGEAHVEHAADTPAQRNLWAARLDDAVLRAEKPVLLVASGASCFAAAWWARLSPGDYVSRVAGALLLDPLGRRGNADMEALFASPRTALPFPTMVVSGERARRDAAAHVQALAQRWGGGVVRLPVRGRSLQTGAGLQVVQEMLLGVAARVVERRMRVADALGVALDSTG